MMSLDDMSGERRMIQLCMGDTRRDKFFYELDTNNESWYLEYEDGTPIKRHVIVSQDMMNIIKYYIAEGFAVDDIEMECDRYNEIYKPFFRNLDNNNIESFSNELDTIQNDQKISLCGVSLVKNATREYIKVKSNGRITFNTHRNVSEELLPIVYQQ